MPIFSYFVVTGSVLIALLFVTDATLEKPTPFWFTSDFMGLPKAWHSEMQNFVANPAPEPDMTSDAVKAATPSAIAVATNGAAVTLPDAKKKHIARNHPVPNVAGQRYAWRPGDNAAHRESPMPWRF
jgi:hypothetical protein